MYTKRSLSRRALPRLATSLALLAYLLPPAAARADETKAKRRPPASGRIEVSTSPGGYPILIDGRPFGPTTEAVLYISLPPGPHTVEILLPNDERWAQTFNVVSGRRNCIRLSRAAQRVELPPQAGDDGNTAGTVCDCGVIPFDFLGVKAGGGGLPKAPLLKSVLKKNKLKNSRKK